MSASRKLKAVGVILLLLSLLITAFTQTVTAKEVNSCKVCFVHNSFVNDQGWSYAHQRGVEYLEANSKGVTTAYVDGIFDTGGTDAEKVFHDFAAQGCNIIFGTSYGYNDMLVNVAKKNPDIVFHNYDQYVLTDNAGSHRAHSEEALYLVGMVAGMKTKSNMIGVVATFPIPQAVREVNAFTLGAQAVNPKTTVKIIWLNSWYDPPREKESAEALANAGADVIQSIATSPTVVQICEKLGVYSIGHVNDLRKFGPKYNLTSMVFEWGTLYQNITQSVIDKTWKADELWYGLKDGVVTVGAYGPAVTDKIKQAVEEMKEKISSGELDVFAGPLKDQKGKLRIAQGKTMTKKDLLKIDWFVEGVETTALK